MIKNLTKAVVGTALLPIDLAADFLTLGNTMNTDPNSEPFTKQRFKNIKRNLDQACDPEK